MCLYLNIQSCNVFSYHFQNYKRNGVQFNGIEMSNFYLKNYSNQVKDEFEIYQLLFQKLNV